MRNSTFSYQGYPRWLLEVLRDQGPRTAPILAMWGSQPGLDVRGFMRLDKLTSSVLCTFM